MDTTRANTRRPLRAAFGALLCLALAAALGAGCEGPAGQAAATGAGGATASGSTGSSTVSSGAGGSTASGSTGTMPLNPDGTCPVLFRFKPEKAVSSVSVAGEWNEFDPEADVMVGPNDQGELTREVKLKPGLWAYKLVIDKATWVLDPEQGYRKYVGGSENSAVQVDDCLLPTLKPLSSKTGSDAFKAKVQYLDGASAAGLEADSVQATLRHHGKEQSVALPIEPGDPSGPVFDVNLSSLVPGKYTLVIRASDKEGRMSEPLRLVFWIEDEAFDWRDAVIYMVMTDRFKNGDPANDPGPTPGVTDARADFHGGDLEGVRQAIEGGSLDKLGVRAIWLTPFAANPTGAYLASDQQHLVSGYHGYWPVRAREVDARLGGEQALRAMVDAAHAHGIRVLMDFVVNHVHQGHEYFKDHPEWFRAGCVCGTSGCDWTEHRLDCVFATYLPDVNYTVPEVTARFVEDAVYWLDTFDLDGLRVDAVKHVEDVAVANLATTVRRMFEAAGTRYFLMGETAMGWTSPIDCQCNFDPACSIQCNKDQYDTISRYIGRFGLDGQFDFVLYHAVPYRVLAYGEEGLAHADFWTQASLATYPAGAIMTPYIGSHDTPRFVSFATYRGQDATHEKGIPGHQWDDVAGPPDDAEPYSRHELALSWLLGLPGAPLLYYGDEYAEHGGADPGNRADWRSDPATLLPAESAVLAKTVLLGAARRSLPAMRRGSYMPVHATADFLAFGRCAPEIGQVAFVALSRAGSPTSTEVTLPNCVPIAEGSMLKDWLGGPAIKVGPGGAVTIELNAWGSAILAPAAP